MRRQSALLAAVGAVALVQACKSSTMPLSAKRLPVLNCVRGTLRADTAVAGELNPAGGCRTLDPLSGESTFTHSYVLATDAGRGYLITMSGANFGTMRSQLELTTTRASGGTPTAASRSGSSAFLTQLVFVSTAAALDTIRATTADALPSDTGSYRLSVRTCRVPVAATDSITHSDTIEPGDCLVDLSLFPFGDRMDSDVHLYPLHATDIHYKRLIAFTSHERLRIFIGGPHEDTFGVTGGSSVTTFTTPDSATSFYFSGRTGDYTLVIGPDQSSNNNFATYTLTIGREQPIR